jgi:hypothetical protein
MSKPNRDQSPEEFIYTFACKKMLHELERVGVFLDEAKLVGLQGDSAGALRNVEGRIYDLKAALYNALKTV